MDNLGIGSFAQLGSLLQGVIARGQFAVGVGAARGQGIGKGEARSGGAFATGGRARRCQALWGNFETDMVAVWIYPTTPHY